MASAAFHACALFCRKVWSETYFLLCLKFIVTIMILYLQILDYLLMEEDSYFESFIQQVDYKKDYCWNFQVLYVNSKRSKESMPLGGSKVQDTCLEGQKEIPKTIVISDTSLKRIK